MKVYIRTTGERILHPSIQRELGNNYQLLIDREHKPIESFMSQLELISEDDALLLEDDIILCHNFLQEVNKAISQFPNLVINFFNQPFEYYTSHIATNHFCWNQCTFYPKGLAKTIADAMRVQKGTFTQYDNLEKVAMTYKGIAYVNYRPMLVQHIDKDTLIQKKTQGIRRTRYFKDYLDELGIDMNNAYRYNYQLQKILDREFPKDSVGGGEK